VNPEHRRVRIDLAYDGTDFAGWQFQPGQRTVQGLLEDELTRLAGGDPVRIRGAGRTDSGAHARGQVADTEFTKRLDDERLAHALRSVLPRDVRPLRVRSVEPGFHSCLSALRKTYVYQLDLSVCGDPFRSRYALHHPKPLELDAIRRGLALLAGKRDWSGFTASSCTIEDRVRTLKTACLETPTASTARFRFECDGFLTHMVRNIVGTLLKIGRGRMPVSRIREILETGDRGLAGPTAAAHGLCLLGIVYPGEVDEDAPPRA
jgi:tRNA pseudouridine38-40 synthase